MFAIEIGSLRLLLAVNRPMKKSKSFSRNGRLSAKCRPFSDVMVCQI